MFKTIVNAFLSATVLFSCFGIIPNAKTPTYSSDYQLLSYNVDAEHVYFDTREQELIETVNGVPRYVQTSEYSNACGPIAGAIVVGFYDKYYEDLIPEYVSYFPATGKYRNSGAAVTSLIGDLYTRMRTNVDDVGVNESDCLNGLKSYVESKTHSMSYTKLNFGSKLNESSYMTSLQNNHPTLIFSEPTELYQFSLLDNCQIITISKVNGNHIFVGYGYLKIYYHMSDNSVRTDTYLRVATGLPEYDSAFLRIASTEISVKTNWLMNAYSIIIN